MTKGNAIRYYRKYSGAHGYIIGFTYKKKNYMIKIEGDIKPRFLKMGKQSSKKGGNEKLDLYLNNELKEELIRKHLYYRHKIKEFLLAVALGMRPSKQYNGTESAVAGFVMVDAQGKLLAYRKTERQVFAYYLFTHTRLEKGNPEKDKYGYLERENRQYYLKLNLKVSFTKR